jgi:hypothetical protein
MADQDRARADTAQARASNPVPVTPSEKTERPAGTAFDVEKDADLRGMPTGDQHPRNPVSPPSRESGGGVGLAIPGDTGGEAEVEDHPAR